MGHPPRFKPPIGRPAKDGMGNESIEPSGKMGLAAPPYPESKPLRLNMTFKAGAFLLNLLHFQIMLRTGPGSPSGLPAGSVLADFNLDRVKAGNARVRRNDEQPALANGCRSQRRVLLFPMP